MYLKDALRQFKGSVLWGKNTNSRVSLILSLNHLGFLIFVLFTLEEEENLKKKKKTFEEKIVRLSLPNMFNLFPLLIVVIHFIVMF